MLGCKGEFIMNELAEIRGRVLDLQVLLENYIVDGIDFAAGRNMQAEQDALTAYYDKAIGYCLSLKWMLDADGELARLLRKLHMMKHWHQNNKNVMIMINLLS